MVVYEDLAEIVGGVLGQILLREVRNSAMTNIAPAKNLLGDGESEKRVTETHIEQLQ